MNGDRSMKDVNEVSDMMNGIAYCKVGKMNATTRMANMVCTVSIIGLHDLDMQVQVFVSHYNIDYHSEDF